MRARTWSQALLRFGRRVPASRLRGEIGKGGSEILRDLVTPVTRKLPTRSPGVGSDRRSDSTRDAAELGGAAGWMAAVAARDVSPARLPLGAILAAEHLVAAGDGGLLALTTAVLTTHDVSFQLNLVGAIPLPQTFPAIRP